MRLLLAAPVAGILFVGGFLVACGTAQEEEERTQRQVTVTQNGTIATRVVETLDSGDVITKFDRQVERFTITAAGDQRTLDDRAVEQVEQAGGDPTQPRVLSYFLIFPSNAAAERAADDLQARGFRVDADYTADFDEGWLVVERRGVLVDRAETEALLEDVAARYGGTYDGWEAATEP